MTTAAHETAGLPDWDDFKRDYVDEGVPHLFVVRAHPRIALFVDQHSVRMGALIALSDHAPVPPSPLEEISTVAVRSEGIRYLEIAVGSRALYRNFFRLLTDIIESVVAGTHPLSALAASVVEWKTLLKAPDLLSEERQAGIFGELWLLRRIIPHLGSASLDAWTGPHRQAHDFRIGHNEFEVKTTSGSRRIHLINGAGQLQPSTDCRLYLLSLQLTDAGAGGQTLGEAVGAIVDDLSPWFGSADRFVELLALQGYRPADAARYPRRRRLRGQALLVPVIDGCPRITPPLLATLPPAYSPTRIGRVTYEIDVEGLGFADGVPEFVDVLPSAQPAGVPN